MASGGKAACGPATRHRSAAVWQRQARVRRGAPGGRPARLCWQLRAQHGQAANVANLTRFAPLQLRSRAARAPQVTANPELRGVVVSGANVLPQRVIQDAFRSQHGRTLNFSDFSAALKRLNRWYEDRELFGQARARRLWFPLRPCSLQYTLPCTEAAVCSQALRRPCSMRESGVQR